MTKQQKEILLKVWNCWKNLIAENLMTLSSQI